MDQTYNNLPPDVLELSELSDNATWNVIPGENVTQSYHTAVVIRC